MVLTRYRSILQKICHNCRQRLFSTTATQPQSIKDNGSQYISNDRKFTVAVEGNIGCGKSTLLRYFKDCPTVETLQEPVDKWTNLHGYNALNHLYEEPKRWSFMFNNYAMLSRLEQHDYLQMAPVKMMERSLHSTQQIFVRNSHEMGHLAGVEHQVLQNWFDYLLKQPATRVDLFVYVRVSPDVCLERIQKRNRKEETEISLTFLECLHKLHENWLIHQNNTMATPVLVVDANKDLESMQDIYEEHRTRILCGCD